MIVGFVAVAVADLVKTPSPLALAIVGVCAVVGAIVLQVVVQVAWSYIRQPLRDVETAVEGILDKLDELQTSVAALVEAGSREDRKQEQLAALGVLLSRGVNLTTAYELCDDENYPAARGGAVDDLVRWMAEVGTTVVLTLGHHEKALLDAYKNAHERDFKSKWVDSSHNGIWTYRWSRATSEWLRLKIEELRVQPA